MLAAVALTAAFVAVVLPFTGRMVERWWRGETSIQDADAWMQLTARLADDLAQAIPMPTAPGRRPNLLFRTDRSSIVFVRPGRDTPDLLLSAYVIERAAAGDTLVNYAARYNSALTQADPRSLGAATSVMSGPFRLAFVAVGTDGSRTDIWSDRREMPRRIELTIAPFGRDTAQAVPIVLPVAAQAPRNAVTVQAPGPDAR